MSAPKTSSLSHAKLRSESWNKAMAASPGNLDLSVTAGDVDGTIPEVLYGTRLLSNGPGWTRIGDRTAHPFDGHGYVRAFTFRPDGGCDLKARFVETPSYLAERDAKTMQHRGFATNLGGPIWRNWGFGEARNVANTTITRWGDRLLAGWEAGAPYALDAETLQTRGEEHFKGVVEGLATLAHVKHDANGERLVICNMANGRQTKFTFRELDTEDNVVSTSEAAIDGMAFTHDFAMSPSHFVLGGNPLRLKPFEIAKMLAGTSTLLKSVAADAKKPGVLYLVPRGGGPTKTIALPGPAFVVHFGNAFELDGSLIIDACVFSHFEFGEEFGYTGPKSEFDPSLPDARGPQKLVRITVAPGATEATWAPLTEHGVDFPRFHPEHEGIDTPLLFGATRRDKRFSDPFDSVIGLDLHNRERPEQLWTAPEHVFVGEPLFAPDPDDAAKGHVLVLLSDGLQEHTTLAILNATALDSGPVATIRWPLLPIAFHGDWDSKRLL